MAILVDSRLPYQHASANSSIFALKPIECFLGRVPVSTHPFFSWFFCDPTMAAELNIYEYIKSNILQYFPNQKLTILGDSGTVSRYNSRTSRELLAAPGGTLVVRRRSANSQTFQDEILGAANTAANCGMHSAWMKICTRLRSPRPWMILDVYGVWSHS